MRRNSLALTAIAALASLSACATPEHADRFFLGEATARNIEVQAERPGDLRNSKAVNGESGERAVEAVRRLSQRQADGE